MPTCVNMLSGRCLSKQAYLELQEHRLLRFRTKWSPLNAKGTVQLTFSTKRKGRVAVFFNQLQTDAGPGVDLARMSDDDYVQYIRGTVADFLVDVIQSGTLQRSKRAQSKV